MKFGPKKDEKLHNIIKHNVIWANLNTKLLVYRYMCTCNGLHNYYVFPHLSEHHYKRSVNTLIEGTLCWQAWRSMGTWTACSWCARVPSPAPASCCPSTARECSCTSRSTQSRPATSASTRDLPYMVYSYAWVFSSPKCSWGAIVAGLCPSSLMRHLRALSIIRYHFSLILNISSEFTSMILTELPRNDPWVVSVRSCSNVSGKLHMVTGLEKRVQNGNC